MKLPGCKQPRPTPDYFMRLFYITIAICLLAATTIAKSLPRPSFNDQLFEAVYRVVGADGDIATGFFVSCNSDSGNTSILVTARHVLDNIESDSASIYLRKKTNGGDFELFKYTFPVRYQGTPLYTVHPDSTIDIAAARVPLPTGFDARVIGQSLFADSSDFVDYELKAGTSVSYLGYPEGMAMEHSDYALLRRGAIASHPLAPMTPFLIDGIILRGNSGSPVIVDPGTQVVKGKLQSLSPKLIGIVVNVRVTRQAGDKKPEYLHIGRVVPSTRLLELLHLMNCR
jgi:hypothetical protein